MGHRSRRGIGLVALTSAAVIGLSLVGSGPSLAGGGGHGGSGSPPGTITTIADELNNPRQLSFTPRGDLLVAEAGTGGDGNCIDTPEGEKCLGPTGSVTKVTDRGQVRIVTGLPSLADAQGDLAFGTSDVYSDGRSVSVLIGLGAPPADRVKLGAGAERLGTLMQTRGGDNTAFRTIADLAAWEQKHDPVNDPDSNPVGMLFDRGDYIVADAGGNTVLRVPDRGKIKLLAAFPDGEALAPPFLGLPAGTKIPMQAVPTSVAAKGGDGSYYVSQLTGFPFPVGAANIYQIDPRNPHKKPKVYASGLTNVTDLAFNGRDLYVVQIATNGLLGEPRGSVVKVKPGGTVPADHTVISGPEPLIAPYGIAIRNGSAYVTTGAILAGDGKVIKIRL